MPAAPVLLSHWVVYDHPRDHPDGYIARRWDISADGVAPTLASIQSENIDTVRGMLAEMGLVPLAPMPGDDPAILEVWI